MHHMHTNKIWRPKHGYPIYTYNWVFRWVNMQTQSYCPCAISSEYWFRFQHFIINCKLHWAWITLAFGIQEHNRHDDEPNVTIGADMHMINSMAILAIFSIFFSSMELNFSSNLYIWKYLNRLVLERSKISQSYNHYKGVIVTKRTIRLCSKPLAIAKHMIYIRLDPTEGMGNR